jgi:hypothetical protein
MGFGKSQRALSGWTLEGDYQVVKVLTDNLDSACAIMSIREWVDTVRMQSTERRVSNHTLYFPSHCAELLVRT